MPDHPARTYLDQCRSRLAKAQIGHYMASDFYRRAHFWIGLPLVVASAIVSCTLTVSPEAMPAFVSIAVIVLSICTTVLASLQTFVRPSERAQQHQAVAAAYGVLKREAEAGLLADDDDLRPLVTDLTDRWSAVAATAPVTPRSLRHQARSKTEPLAPDLPPEAEN